MDAAVRVLRDGRAVPDAPAAFVIVMDELPVLGGSAVLLQCTRALAAAVAQGRSQGGALDGVAVDRPPSELLGAGVRSVTDLFSDPCGWISSCTCLGPAAASAGAPSPSPATAHTPAAAAAGEAEAAESQAGRAAEAAAAAGGKVAESGGGEAAAEVAAGTAAAGGLVISSSSPWPISSLHLIAKLAEKQQQHYQHHQHQNQQLGVQEQQQQLCVVIDSLSALLQRHPAGQVLRVLDALQRSPCISSILTLVHKDLHSPQLLCALQTASTALLDLSPLTPLQRALAAAAGHPAPHGRVRLTAKRRSGRLRAEQQYYALAADGGAQAYTPPAEALAAPDARTLVEHAVAGGSSSGGQTIGQTFSQIGPTVGGVAVAGGSGSGQTVGQTIGRAAAEAAGAGGVGGEGAHRREGGEEEELVRRLGGGSMRLGLTAEERAERTRVVLPFERRGRAAAAAVGAMGAITGGPVAAGGGDGAVAGRLGQILYVRDSEGEADSDEDPDDDLDL